MPPLACTALAAWCAALTVLDLRERRLPNALTCSGALAILGFALFTSHFAVAVLGALLLSSAYLLVHLAAPAGLGAGDVKLAVGLGAAAALGGAQAWVWAALGAPVLTAGGAIATVAIRRLTGPADGPSATGITVPHGPGMCLATLLALLSSALGAS